MWAIRPDVTCSIRPSMRRGGCARASRCSTNARCRDSSRAMGPRASLRRDPGLLLVCATRPTIRALAVLHDGTIVRLGLERGEKAVPPRATMDADRLLAFEGYSLDLANDQLLHGGDMVPLTPKAFAVLRLVEDGGQVVTKKELLRAGWANTHVTDGVLKVRILEIRRALGDDPATPRFIETVSRRGYAFIAPRSCCTNSVGYRARPARRARGRANRRPTSYQLRRLPSSASPARAAAS
jgi:DNA-binding winged helix-turn-helix (wHTH) protein